jgi:hypothetical protein
LRTPAQPIARSAARDFGRFRKPSLFPVLRAADLFHPVDGFARVMGMLLAPLAVSMCSVH